MNCTFYYSHNYTENNIIVSQKKMMHIDSVSKLVVFFECRGL